MPYCIACGNDSSLACSKFSPSADTANATPYGLLGNFDEQGTLVTMECQGASLDDAQAAFEEPDQYFDTCSICGSQKIRW
ncbi:hypothetical protein [Desulforamulus aeronauticus]|uniref:Uncharacterized protein n=1 Tax=Desulforamulus aeronauticus DSM 10349 TaxID=1121421 RepID=A0A1M6SU43_9FIRM|nr:hypothetical protein [Desulforamulus aeronauticus]SHK48215.1 hypothetical protein SAMN02745123_02027 [Desulforamulus aeronauticus DSM 10349]